MPFFETKNFSTGKDNDSSYEFQEGEEGLALTKPSKEGSGGFRLMPAASAVVPPAILGLGLSKCRRSLLLSGTSSVPKGGVS